MTSWIKPINKHSTQYTVLKLADIITQAIDNGVFILGVFLDQTKAFDTDVMRRIVLEWLTNCSINMKKNKDSER